MGCIYYMGKQYLGGGTSYGGTSVPNNNQGSNGDYYYLWDANGDVQVTYIKIGDVWRKVIGGDVIIGEQYYSNDISVYIHGVKETAMEGVVE